MTEEVTTDIQRVTNAFLPAHQVKPQDGKFVDNLCNGYIQLQDWAFIQRFVLIKESFESEQWISQCIHHYGKTEVPEK